MKKTLKAGAFTLSFVLAAGIVAQTSVYAKGASGKSEGKTETKSKVETVQTSDKGKNSEKKALPFGPEGKGNTSKSTLPPVIKQGGVLIPVKAITKAFGANLVWDEKTQIVTITKGDKTIVINLEKKTATVNGKEVAFKDESKTGKGTFVPLKFIIQNLGIDLSKVDLGQATEGTTTGSAISLQEDTSAINTAIQTLTTSTTTQTSTDNTTTTGIQVSK